MPFPGPEVHPFNLTQIAVTPGVILPGASVNYSAIYQSPTNTAPTLAAVDIDGTTFQLQANGNNYRQGVRYSFNTSTLYIGVHYYRFRFNDGSGEAIFEGQERERPSVTPLTLSNSSVNPQSGTTQTVFTFQTTYTDMAGNAPAQAMLSVDKVTYAMKFISGSYKTGAVFQVKTTLPSGKHSFFFVFSNTASSWADPFAPSTYAGPDVGVNAQPVLPGSFIYPSHDVNPDLLNVDPN